MLSTRFGRSTRLRNVMCSSTPKGTSEYCILLSLQQTLRCRGVRFLIFFDLARSKSKIEAGANLCRRVTRVECSRRRGCVSQVVGAGGVISTWTLRGLADGKFGGLAGRESVRFDFKCYTQVMSWRDWRKDFGDAAGVQAARQSPRRPQYLAVLRLGQELCLADLVPQRFRIC